jgi:heme peroxidase
MPQLIVAKDRRLFAADAEFAAATERKAAAIVQICANWAYGNGMRQGYTYLGQFLAHDIASRELPRKPTTQRTRRLDLDSVYGAGARFDQLGRFLYCAASPLYTMDLLRDPVTKEACIPDFRNDEHPIISQLHLTIQLFHNAALRVIQTSASGHDLDASRQFDFARRYVVATVQRIYVEDYLRTCSDPQIYEAHVAGRLRAFDVPATEDQLPLEITHAAMRFGHSQVRDLYLLNADETETRLDELLFLSGQFVGPAFRGIPKAKAVDWRRFFGWGRGQNGIRPGAGRRIGPNIVEPMSNLRELPAPGEPPIPSIVVRNIAAGTRALLPSGQTVASRLAQLRLDERISPELQLQAHDASQEARLRAHDLWDDTPLWLFLLIEASSQGKDGMHLGPIGSVFLCETIRSALEGQESYVTVQSAFEKEFGLRRIGTFEQLVKFTDPDTYDCVP